MPQIEVNELAKKFKILVKKPGLIGTLYAFIKSEYRTIEAVYNINFSIEPGELVGYIGANGAGKSTTVKLLSGVLEPSSGSVSVIGRNPCRKRLENARDIGVVFGQKTQLWWDLPVIESYNLLQKIYEVPDKIYRARLEEIIEALELREILYQPVRLLSLGQRMRCDLAAPFLHEPKIVYLDEPTIGLDISVKARIRKFLKDYCKRFKTTLFLTTHDLRDIEEITERVILIDRGKKLYDGNLIGLRKTLGEQRKLTLELDTEFNLQKFNEKYLGCGNSVEIETSQKTAIIKFDPGKITAKELLDDVLSQNKIIDFSLEYAQIEDIVRKIYG